MVHRAYGMFLVWSWVPPRVGGMQCFDRVTLFTGSFRVLDLDDYIKRNYEAHYGGRKLQVCGRARPLLSGWLILYRGGGSYADCPNARLWLQTLVKGA